MRTNTHAKVVLRCCFIAVIACFWMSCEDERVVLSSTANETRTVNTLFQSLSSDITGVDFVNRLDEGPNTNILLYEYFYNGGGVAAGDLNGDGWEDLYFTTNLGQNKLYLHQGEKATTPIAYTDITEVAGAGGRVGPWKTGVSLADVNGDGKLDIYLSYSGMLPPVKRKNQLYINLGNDQNGIPKFEDQAEVVGLASPGFSTQAYFLDYDRDGDLDMLLLNHNPTNLPILNEAQTAELFNIDDPDRGLRLYNQKEGKFSDVTKSAGLNGSALSYGLGLAIGDLNNDGWPDFYVSNDYAVPDYLYINDQKGGFSNQLSNQIGHTSQFSMGNDITDVNNDGNLDIITLDMLPEDNKRQKSLIAPDDYAKFDHNVRSGFYYQYMRNMLQLNNGDGTYSEVGQYAGIPSTDWSWAALSADYNNDGFRDLFVTNGYKRDFTNLDFINYMNDYTSSKGKLKKEDVLEVIQNMPSSDVANYMYSGSKEIKFHDVGQLWGVSEVANSNGAVYADLDNDGDLDLVVNNINKPAFIYANQSDQSADHNFLKVKLEGDEKNLYGIGSRVEIIAGDQQWMAEQYPARGYQSSVSPNIHIGLGAVQQLDAVMITWPNGSYQKLENVKANQLLIVKKSNANESAPQKSEVLSEFFQKNKSPLNFKHVNPERRDYDRQALLLTELSHDGPPLSSADVNGDGIPDLYIGGGAGQVGQLYIGLVNGSFRLKKNAAFSTDWESVDTDALFLDVDGDGDQDLYVVSGGYHLLNEGDAVLQDRLYLNNGKGIFSKSDGLPEMLTSTSTVVALDIDQDDDLDLFIGGKVVPGVYPKSPRSYLLKNDGAGNYKDVTLDFAEALAYVGLVTDAIAIDVNQDGAEDVIVVGQWMDIKIFLNENGILKDRSSTYLGSNASGFWNTISTADFNNDGRPDFLVGNSGTNTQFLPIVDEPVEVYFKDFDDNGSIDPIVTQYVQGVKYPYATRDELLRQLTKYRSTYTSYEKYATATFDELIDKNDLVDADHLQVTSTSSMILLSQANGFYLSIPLPKEAQYSPIRSFVIADFNKDGNQDFICLGNNSRVKLRMGKSDANYGIMMLGDGHGGFAYVNQKESGLSIKGDVDGAILIADQLIIGKSDSEVETYKVLNRN